MKSFLVFREEVYASELTMEDLFLNEDDFFRGPFETIDEANEFKKEFEKSTGQAVKVVQVSFNFEEMESSKRLLC